jgi:hypothetical protein
MLSPAGQSSLFTNSAVITPTTWAGLTSEWGAQEFELSLFTC